MRSSAEDTAAMGKKPQAAAETPLDASLNLISYNSKYILKAPMTVSPGW